MATGRGVSTLGTSPATTTSDSLRSEVPTPVFAVTGSGGPSSVPAN